MAMSDELYDCGQFTVHPFYAVTGNDDGTRQLSGGNEGSGQTRQSEPNEHRD